MYDNNKKATRGEIETIIRFLYYVRSGIISLEGRL